MNQINPLGVQRSYIRIGERSKGVSTHLELESLPIRQTWLFRVHLSIDRLQVPVELAIIEGA